MVAADELDWEAAFLAPMSAIIEQLRRVQPAGSAASGAQAVTALCRATADGHSMGASHMDASLRFLQLLVDLLPAERWSPVWQQV